MKIEFKEVLKQEKVSGKEISNELRMSYGSYRSALSKFGTPRWVRAFLYGYNLRK